MFRSRGVRVGAVAVALCLTAAACGGSKKHTAAPTTTSTTTSTTTTPSSTSSSSSTTAPAQAKFTPKPVSWHACSSSQGPTQPGYQCAEVMVPLNPAQAGGPQISIGIDRHMATGTKKGSLIINPGGPGESAVDELPDLVKMLGADLVSSYDIVGYDPPGVGHSDPITCLDQQQYAAYLHEDPAPPGPNGFSLATSENRAFAQGCEQRSGAILPYVSTVDAARDMEYVREALGDGKLNYLGFSYGTFLGATYAGMYGSDVRSMTLDGALDPSEAITPFLMAQATSLDTEFDTFAQQCESDTSCPWHEGAGNGGNLVNAFQALLAKVRQTPLQVPGEGTVGPSELLYGTVAGLYSTASWPFIYQALADAEQGDGSEILEAFQEYVGDTNGVYDNSLEAENAVNCLDDPAPTSAQLQADLPTFTAAAPVFGPSVVYGELSCVVWPVKATGSPHAITAPQAPTIVVVGSTGDPVTPYAGAQHLASELTHGVLLTRDGAGHTGYGASTCVENDVDNYILTLQAPAKGTVCQSDSSSS